MPLPKLLPRPCSKGKFAFKHLGRAFLSLVFPRVCPACGLPVEDEEDALCAVCLRQIAWLAPPFCAVCGEPKKACEGHQRPGHLNGVWACAWHQGLLANLIADYKYEGRIELGASLARLLHKYSEWWRDEPFDCLAPVPLHRRRLAQRGFNQALIMAKALNYKKVEPELLIRTHLKPPQVGLTRAQRAENVKGIFAVHPARDIAGLNILLLDDVWTTGATMRECAATLKKAGAARVGALTLARAPLE